MRLDEEAREEIALRLGAIALEAGRLLRRFERSREFRVKADGSPTTPADLAAEELILARLAKAWPGVPAVAEETANAAEPGDLFFLVDPLDGTRDFLHGEGEYSVNIALVSGGRPVAAAVASPALQRVWIAGATAKAAAIPPDGGAMDWAPIRVRPAPVDGLVALVSRRHGDRATEACLAALSIGTLRTASSAVKFCLIASGEADVYVRCGATMEWDTAAGDHVLTRAGGCVVKAGGGPLAYGRSDRGYLNGPFAALGDPALAPRLDLPLAAA
ncbi:MAG TPA: 3'(2'),5'-bisphosphate nucleotidase CysQ [Beijerinckiaceae bacterium]|jgi:3'(2'), 5'-bisphosphate nucleotidase